MIESRGNLLRVEARVERNENRAELEDGICEGSEFGAIAETDGHAVAFLHA